MNYPQLFGRRALLTGAASTLSAFCLAGGVARAGQTQDADQGRSDGLSARADELRGRLRGERTAFEEQAEAWRRSYAEYAAAVRSAWGQGATLPEGLVLAEYNSASGTRRVVEFEEGRAEVSALVSLDESPESPAVRNALAKELEGMLTEGVDQRTLESLATAPGAPERGGQPVLANQVDFAGGSAASFAEKVASGPLDTDIIEGADGIRRQIVSVDFRLVPDHIARRAAQYVKPVESNADEYAVNTPIVWAVIETESAFQPRAKSPVPAFGLMQLVPASGGRDAYRYVYRQDRIVSEDFLYSPENNIKLGTAYLRLVYDNYLNWIEDDRTRLWATVASYNTGSGNVRKAFGRNEREASRVVNAMTSDEAFEHMQRRLPYEETRQYIVKVRDKSRKYGSI